MGRLAAEVATVYAGIRGLRPLTGPLAGPREFASKKDHQNLRGRVNLESGAEQAPAPMRMPDDLLKIGDFARVAKTNLRTLRYYEEIGLLTPAGRSDGGFRYYRPTDVNRVRLIWDLQQLGLQLEDIAKLLNTREEGSSPEQLFQRVKFAISEQKRLIQEQISKLETQKTQIGFALAKLSNCDGCSHRPSSENNHCEPCQEDGASLPDLLSALF
ncbi:MAG: DNA-binding transcriptional MerR regulator [Planctomycetota bacterium]